MTVNDHRTADTGSDGEHDYVFGPRAGTEAIFGPSCSVRVIIDKDGDIDLFYPSYRKSQLNAPRGGYFWWENTRKGFKINKNFYLKY